MTENEISYKIINAAIEVHKELGPGLLESAYEISLEKELLLQRLNVQRQVPMPVIYKGAHCDIGYRLDFLIEEKVVIEIKSVESIKEIHIAQILTYLKLSKCKLGLLINFNVPKVKDGIKRLVNNL